jgi:hypothetical protein
MLETCYCGRSGEIESREPVVDDEGRQALRCPDCGHLDHLSWLPAETRQLMFEKAAGIAAPAGATTAA